MKTMGIVSSYSESCGNASFSKVLVDSISASGSVAAEGVGLPLMLTQATDPLLRRCADREIKSIADRISKLDSVNLQVETGLFGVIPSDALRRINWLLAANPNTSLTLHAPRLVSTAHEWRSNAYRNLFRLRINSALRDYAGSLNSEKYVNLNKQIIIAAKNARRPLIVHTQRAKQMIQALFKYENVHVHPLRLVSEPFAPDESVLTKIKTMYQLENKSIIGIFGYISPYKGHTDAIQMLAQLPNNFVLVIAGRQHPQTIKIDTKDQYIGHLEELIKAQVKAQRVGGNVSQINSKIHRNQLADPKVSFAKRVIFLGELPDDDFFNLAASVDVCLLPYYENGQDGSGIASICLDVSPRVLCSSSFAFDELFRLIKYHNYMRFDIGNVLEIAGKVLAITQQPAPQRPFSSGEYTYASQAELYRKLAGFGI